MSAQFLWFALGAFGVFCLLVFAAIRYTPMLRAKCETPFGKFFLETRGRSNRLSGRPQKRLK